MNYPKQDPFTIKRDYRSRAKERCKFFVKTSIAQSEGCWVLEARNQSRDFGTQEIYAYSEAAMSCFRLTGANRGYVAQIMGLGLARRDNWRKQAIALRTHQ